MAADPDAFGSTYARDSAQTEKWWEQWAARSHDGTSQRTFVLIDDGDRWLGLVLVCIEDHRPDSAALTAMWVAPEARGHRGGVLLCDACATWAAERGLHTLTLTVVVDNHAARRTYESAGFALCEQTTWSRDDRTLDVLVMSRRV
ncbi:MAG TPA: GNAT family N-acetyltransferase [Solirubrobacteraceae bacterium]|nr:GNAT family N-acetyltransferase [Solirubrobacteraceae bacterium]